MAEIVVVYINISVIAGPAPWPFVSHQTGRPPAIATTVSLVRIQDSDKGIGETCVMH